jgi:hypothetical protein
MNEQLLAWFDKISKRTETPVNSLVEMALWDFVRSFDWTYEELKEGVIYRQSASADATPAMARA